MFHKAEITIILIGNFMIKKIIFKIISICKIMVIFKFSNLKMMNILHLSQIFTRYGIVKL